jgi:hypothetical protein
MSQWYYAAGMTRKGPYEQEDFRKLVTEGVVTPEALVWTSGMTDWKPWREVSSQFPPSPAGVPPMGVTEPSPDGAVAADATAPAASVPAAAAPLTCSVCGRSFPPDEVIVLEGRPVCAQCKPVAMQKIAEGQPLSLGGFVGTPDELIAAIRARGYEVDIGAAISRSWETMKANLWPAIGAFALILVTTYAISFATNITFGLIPIIGPFLTMFIQLGAAPLSTGAIYYFIRQVRGESPEIKDVFIAFSKCYLPLLLVSIVPGLLIMVPAILVAVVAAVAANSGAPMALMVILGIILFGGLMAGMIYISVCWFFAASLITDMKMGFLDAIRVSRAVVHLHWWSVLGFMIVTGLLSSAGMLACCIGIFFTAPLALGAMAAQYTAIFGAARGTPPSA